MALTWKIDVLDALKEKGITTYAMRKLVKKEDRLGESAIQKLRNGEGLGWDNIERLCKLLECQPADLMEYIPEETKEE
ncbi:MAG: helix-turn-helix transcriptional regulator [Firmicutes bacterium]|nr:helix-turn-helix transcriptional regulator [Bacillota bacterium]